MRAIKREQSVVSQLREGILEVIAERGLKAGDKLPSEEQMTEAFRVSRPALREALKLLEQDGVIRVEHGKGRFLTATSALRVDRPITCFESVTAMIAGFGYRPETRVLSVAKVCPDEEVAAALQCPRDAKVLRVERLRVEKGKPLVYSVDWLPESVAPAGSTPLVWTGSIVELLDGAGFAPVMSTAAASAVMLPSPAVAAHGLDTFGPAFLISETCFAEDGVPVLFARVYHRGDAFSFSFVRR